jgi:hypothetical protein
MGTGEAGNWGAHIIDDALNFVGITQAPRSAWSVGGRLGYDDDGETPNTLLVAFETGSFPLVAQFRALPMRPGLEAMDHFRGIRIGTVIECENGYYAGGRGGGWIYDGDGQRVEQVEGDGGSAHVQNFLDAVRSRKPQDLNAPMQVGHMSALHCHLGNMSYRLGKQVPAEAARQAVQSSPLASDQLDRMIAHLAANGVDASTPTLALGDVIQMDPRTDTCVGPNAAAASALAKRTYREPVYEALFDIARENVAIKNVVIAGPFTKEIADPSWPEKLSEKLCCPVEVHYVQCSPGVRRQRLAVRGDARDRAKLQDWDRYIEYYGEESPPVFEHVLVNGEYTYKLNE